MSDDPKRNKKTPNSTPKGGEIVSAPDHRVGPGEAVQAKPLEVVVYDGNFEKALRAFRALVQKERILSLFKEKQSYEKPSVKKRRKRAEMKRKKFELENKQRETPEQRKQRKIRKLENAANTQ
jgi:small subunit ribosomal protein S21